MARDSRAAEGKYLGVNEILISCCFLGPLSCHTDLLEALLWSFLLSPSPPLGFNGFARLCLIFSNFLALSSASDRGLDSEIIAGILEVRIGSEQLSFDSSEIYKDFYKT